MDINGQEEIGVHGGGGVESGDTTPMTSISGVSNDSLSVNQAAGVLAPSTILTFGSTTHRSYFLVIVLICRIPTYFALLYQLIFGSCKGRNTE